MRFITAVDCFFFVSGFTLYKNFAKIYTVLQNFLSKLVDGRTNHPRRKQNRRHGCNSCVGCDVFSDNGSKVRLPRASSDRHIRHQRLPGQSYGCWDWLWNVGCSVAHWSDAGTTHQCHAVRLLAARRRSTWTGARSLLPTFIPLSHSYCLPISIVVSGVV